MLKWLLVVALALAGQWLLVVALVAVFLLVAVVKANLWVVRHAARAVTRL